MADFSSRMGCHCRFGPVVSAVRTRCELTVGRFRKGKRYTVIFVISEPSLFPKLKFGVTQCLKMSH